MKVLFEPAAVPATSKDPRTGEAAPGKLYFRLVHYEQEEEKRGVPVRDLRTKMKQPVTLDPPAVTDGGRPVVIPNAVLESLPDDANVGIEWSWIRDKP